MNRNLAESQSESAQDSYRHKIIDKPGKQEQIQTTFETVISIKAPLNEANT